MAGLVYSGIVSLDGYVNDAQGGFDWSAPDEEVHAAVNDLERGIGTHLLGRRMWDVLKVWQTFGTASDEPAVIRDYGEIWRGADKVVYSTTLASVSTPRTRLERSFDPEAIRAMKADAARDISIGGPTLAAAAIAAGLVDEWHLFVSPIVVGGGTRFWPQGTQHQLELLGERRFANGVVHLHYSSR